MELERNKIYWDHLLVESASNLGVFDVKVIHLLVRGANSRARHPELFLVPDVAMENTYRPAMPVGPVYATLSLGGVEPFAFLITD